MNGARESAFTTVLIAGLALATISPVRADDFSNQVNSAAEAAREEASQRRAKLPFAKGTLKDLDLLRHQLRLKTEDGLRTFTYTARTYIFRDKDKIAVDQLKPGEVVAVRFVTDKDGASTLVRVKSYGPPSSPDAGPLGAPASTNQPAGNAP